MMIPTTRRRQPLIWICCVILLIFSPCCWCYDAYTDYRLLQITPQTEQQANILISFLNNPNHTGSIDVWSSAHQLFSPWTVFLSPSAAKQWDLEMQVHFNASALQDLSHQLQKDLRAHQTRNEMAQRRARRSIGDSIKNSHQHYRPYDEISGWLENRAAQYSIATLSTIGRTKEGRAMLMLKVSTNDKKPIIWIDAGIHAREWIAPATALYLIDMLLSDSEEARKLLDNYQFYIVPVVNPDGYEYTHTTARLWRKNRSRIPGSYCVGVDLNRNFPFKWGGGGSSENPCDAIYRGPAGNSELETQAVTAKLIELKDNVKFYLTLHSYGQFIMMPFGHATLTYPDSFQKMIQMSHNVASALRRRYGRFYMIGSSADVMYAAAGGSGDYAAGELLIPHSATIELPDRGRYGFLLPPTYIVNVGRQMWDTLCMFGSLM